jgi:gliding motility-associated-like protein
VDSGKWIVNATEVLNHPDCKGSVSQVFTYRPRLEIPSLITPNGDGKNDRLVIQDLEFYPNHHLQIFNRWGIKVLDASNLQKRLEGRMRGFIFTT